LRDYVYKIAVILKLVVRKKCNHHLKHLAQQFSILTIKLA